MSPSELRRIEGEDVHVRRHLHALDPCHLTLGVQAAAERRPRNGDLRCDGGGEAPFQMINHLSRIAATPQ
jgi:hypothetical protein